MRYKKKTWSREIILSQLGMAANCPLQVGCRYCGP